MRFSQLIAKIENATISGAKKIGPALKDAKGAVAAAKLDFKARRVQRREEEEARVRARVEELKAKQ